MSYFYTEEDTLKFKLELSYLLVGKDPFRSYLYL